MCSKTSPSCASCSLEHGQKDGEVAEMKSARSGVLMSKGSNFEFEFGISGGSGYESSSADELFANGVILPIQIRNGNFSPKRKSTSEVKVLPSEELLGNGVIVPIQIRNGNLSPKRSCTSEAEVLPLPFLSPIITSPTTCNADKKMERPKQITPSTLGSDHKKPQSTSVWGFRRSTSLNTDNSWTKKASVFSLQLLSRSKSTGSVPTPRRSASHRQQQSTLSKSPSSSLSSYLLSTSNSHPSLQKSRLRSNHGLSAFRGNMIHVSPVLNFPTTGVSKRAANLFSLSCFTTKEKKNRR